MNPADNRDELVELRLANETLRHEVENLTRLRDTMLALGKMPDRAVLLDEFTHSTLKLLGFERGLVLLDDGNHALKFGAYSQPAPTRQAQFLLEQLHIDLEGAAEDSLLCLWYAGTPTLIGNAADHPDSRFDWVLKTLNLRSFYAAPLMVGDQFRGVVLLEVDPAGFTREQQTLVDALAASMAVTLENARLYRLTDEQLSARVQELEILSRIDHELNHTLSVERVLNLVLDWALRFTNSQAAAVVLVDHADDTMEFVAGYGYSRETWDELQAARWSLGKGVSGRVARTGYLANVPDVSADPDYVLVVPGTRSQLSVPITREDRVIGVISLESPVQDAFTRDNEEFIGRLAARAATAIDNANLFDETRRERQKLELIVRNIADGVIVVGDDGQLVLVNQAALATFRLLPRETYAGRAFAEVFQHSLLLPVFERALKIRQGLVEQLALSDGRVFHVSIVPEPLVGWSIVMHDITPFKETEKLKNELVATASHDLKNPLGAIMGYVDLIGMTNKLNPQGQEYMRRVHDAVAHMRHLIDDLLDMARIESGITLKYSRINLSALVRTTVEQFHPLINDKAMQVDARIPPDLPLVCADEGRLTQVLSNLVSNAIKYTPPEGQVWVEAEKLDTVIKIVVRDTGLGISPEDQAQVFTRFYRVRTPETDSIEGTGLGLAIVKSLVELHGGEIGLESRLGEGSTFYLTLPLDAPPDAKWMV